MTQTDNKGFKVLEAADGFMLVKRGADVAEAAKKVYLGVGDSPDEYVEVREEYCKERAKESLAGRKDVLPINENTQ